MSNFLEEKITIEVTRQELVLMNSANVFLLKYAKLKNSNAELISKAIYRLNDNLFIGLTESQADELKAEIAIKNLTKDV